MAKNESPKHSRWIKHLLGILMTALCVFVFVIKIDFSDILQSFKNFQWPYLYLGIITLGIGYVFRVFRWSIMLRSAGADADFWACTAPFLGSIALNNVIPFRLGDVVRAFVFPKSMGITRTVSTSTILIERLIDIVALTSIFSVGLITLHQIKAPVGFQLIAVGVVIGGVTILFLLFLFCNNLGLFFKNLSAGNISSNRLQKLYKLLSNFLIDLNFISQPKIILSISFFTVLVWSGEAGLFYFVMLGAGVETTFWTIMFVMAATTLSTLIPSSPGYIGTFHLAAFTAMTLLGTSVAEAASSAVIIHLALWLPTTVVGALAIWTRPELLIWTKNNFNKNI